MLSAFRSPLFHLNVDVRIICWWTIQVMRYNPSIIHTTSLKYRPLSHRRHTGYLLWLADVSFSDGRGHHLLHFSSSAHDAFGLSLSHSPCVKQRITVSYVSGWVADSGILTWTAKSICCSVRSLNVSFRIIMMCLWGRLLFWNSNIQTLPIIVPKIFRSIRFVISSHNLMLNNLATKSCWSWGSCSGSSSAVISVHFRLHVNIKKRSGQTYLRTIAMTF